MLQLIVIAALQGITEFLPISSSGHLILIPWLTGWPDQGAEIDIAVHVGTLLAVLVYFHRDFGSLALGGFNLARGRWTPPGRLLLLLIVATVPVVAIGYGIAAAGLLPGLRQPVIIAWTTVGFGILLYVVDRVSMRLNRIDHLGLGGFVVLGLAQALALIPGTSRSGITITAGRLLGLERDEAARVALLMAAPTIVAAGGYGAWQLWQSDNFALQSDAVIAAGLAFATALAAIALMMAWVRHASYTPFVVYRLILGGFLLYWVYY
jgi:undecaprenyl-diphosphatase